MSWSEALVSGELYYRSGSANKALASTSAEFRDFLASDTKSDVQAEMFAYQLDSDGSTQFDSTNQDMPQGTELSASSLPSDGFYVGHYYFGISLDGH